MVLARILFREVPRDGVTDGPKTVQLVGSELVDEMPANGCDMVRRRPLNGFETLLRQPDDRSSPIVRARFAFNQTASLHPADMVRKPAGGPLKVRSELGGAP